LGEVIISGEGLTKRFLLRSRFGRRSFIHAVNDVDLFVREREIVGLVGESGCGKSTVSRMLVGIEEATSGEVRLRGEKVSAPQHWRSLRRAVQYVFQDPYGSLPPMMSVGDIVGDPLDIHRIGPKTERRDRVARMLHLVGLSESDMEKKPGAFSGGQRQRISIARALALEPRVVICDEVVSGLDVSIQAQVLNLLLDLREQLGLAYLFISHDLRVVHYLCDRVAVMYLGQIVEEGPVEEVFARPRHPYTVGLLASVPDPRAETLRAGVPGEPPSLFEVPTGCPFATRCPRMQPVCIETELPRSGDGHQVRCHFPMDVPPPPQRQEG
jgi:oligopeptide/dipeptide ABC transporter ATP-binding protein